RGASTRASGLCSTPPAPAPARRSCRRSPAAGRRPSSTCRATPRPSAATSRPLLAKATSQTRCGRSTFSRTHFTWRRSFAWCRARPFCDSSDTDRLDRQWVWVGSYPDRMADSRPLLLLGIAVSDGRAAGDRFQIILDVESLQLRGQDQGVTGRVRLDVGGSSSQDLALIEGDRVEAWAVLRLPHGFGTPGAYDAAAQAR